MFKPVSADLLQAHIADFKMRFSPVLTLSNYYNNPLEEKKWLLNIKDEGLFFIGTELSTNMNHYYFLAEADSLSEADLIFPQDKKLVSEFVFNSQPNTSVINHYEALGFKTYAQLKKMSLLKKDVTIVPSKNIDLCTLDDLSFLRNIFNLQFDPVSERYPTDNELQSAINSGSIFKYVDNNRLLGFYWADTKKFLTELRYLFVDADCRGRGIGRALFEHHLFVTQAVKKNQLWVLENNTAAIALYQKFGYGYEGLQDLIFVKE